MFLDYNLNSLDNGGLMMLSSCLHLPSHQPPPCSLCSRHAQLLCSKASPSLQDLCTGGAFAGIPFLLIWASLFLIFILVHHLTSMTCSDRCILLYLPIFTSNKHLRKEAQLDSTIPPLPLGSPSRLGLHIHHIIIIVLLPTLGCKLHEGGDQVTPLSPVPHT